MKTQTQQHTPTPWTLRTRKTKSYNGHEFKYKNVELTIHELSVKREPIAGLPASYVCADILSVNKENLAFIVRAVNSYEALLEAVKETGKLAHIRSGHQAYLNECKHKECVLVSKAIAQAEGK